MYFKLRSTNNDIQTQRKPYPGSAEAWGGSARLGPERIEHCMRAADAVGITTIVRVPDEHK